MAEVVLSFENFQDKIPIHKSKIQKAAIEASILKNWDLEPSAYRITFDDMDGDEIDAKQKSDYDFARRI